MGDRIQRLNSLLAEELSLLLRRRFRSEAALLSITRADVSADLRDANVYFSAPDDAAIEVGQRFLEKCRGKLKYHLARRIPIHHFPELHFRFDRAILGELRVNQILDGLAAEELKKDT
jgi:ribosome-binding factor A